MILSLPLEILIDIFEAVDDVRDLWNLRTASWTLCAAATPIAFRVLSVTKTAGSAQNIGRLFDLPDIAAHVREVSYRDTGDNRQERTQRLVGGSVRTLAIPQLFSSFSRIHQLPLLESINLTFFPFDDTHESWSESRICLSLQASIIGALAVSFSISPPLRPPSKLISLSLHNLRTSDLSPLSSLPFQTVLKTLRRFQLSVLLDFNTHEVMPFNRWLQFWGNVFPNVILSPMQHSLTELTLHNKKLLGASSELSLSGLHFPHLCALSLGRLVFEPSVGVERFILQHAPTLSRLELISCRLLMDHDNEMYISTSRSILSSPPSFTILTGNEFGPRLIHWARIWDSFSAELAALVVLHVDERDRLEYISKFRYVRRSRLLLQYLVFSSNETLNAIDAEAFERFHMTVAARAKEIRGELEATPKP